MLIYLLKSALANKFSVVGFRIQNKSHNSEVSYV